MNMENFNREHFISYISNVYIQINRAIIFKELEHVDHFIGDELYNNIKFNLDELSKGHKMQFFYDMNVAHVEILEIKEEDNLVQIKVKLISGYGKFVSSSNLYGKERINYMTFERRKGSKPQPVARFCPGCGANIDVNRSGICEYCETVYNLEDMDWILIKLDQE